MKVKFYVGMGQVSKEIVVSFSDDASDDDIDEAYNEWMQDQLDQSWQKVED